MSGSITDSDTGGNDWDETWTPQQGARFESFKIACIPLWQTIRIKVHFLDRKTSDHVSACLVPWKMQFFIQRNLQKLQKIIRNITNLDIESINSSNELLEITIKSHDQDDVFTKIETAILNECDDVIMKTVLKYAFTEKLAEEICLKPLREGKIVLFSDNTKVCIVGLTYMKDCITKAVNEINRVTVKKSIKWTEKWKMAATVRFGMIETLSTNFRDIVIGIQEDGSCVNFHGRDVIVDRAIKELDKLQSALFVEKIDLDPLMTKLLSLPEASVLFTNVLESKQFPVVWIVDGEKLCIFSKSKVDKNGIRYGIYEHFNEVGFSTCVVNKRSFVHSKSFVAVTNTNANKLLITEVTGTGFIVASTKAIILELLHMEKMFYLDECNTKDIQVNIQDIQIRKLEADKERLENSLQYTMLYWKLEMKNRKKAEENYEREKRCKRNLETRFDNKISLIERQIEQLKSQCNNESHAKETIRQELSRTKEQLTNIEKDFKCLLNERASFEQLTQKLKDKSYQHTNVNHKIEDECSKPKVEQFEMDIDGIDSELNPTVLPEKQIREAEKNTTESLIPSYNTFADNGEKNTECKYFLRRQNDIFKEDESKSKMKDKRESETTQHAKEMNTHRKMNQEDHMGKDIEESHIRSTFECTRRNSFLIETVSEEDMDDLSIITVTSCEVRPEWIERAKQLKSTNTLTVETSFGKIFLRGSFESVSEAEKMLRSEKCNKIKM